MKDYSVLDELVPKTEELHKAIDNVYEQGYRDGHNDCAEIYKDVYDEAYQKGIEEGSADAKILIENAYRKGLEDAWYVFRIVVKPSMCGGLDIDEMIQIFGTSIHKDIADLSPQDAIEKIKAWEQKGDIKVGDEVICEDKRVVIIKLTEKGWALGMNKDGNISDVNLSRYTRSGIHYDSIEKILKKLRGEE